MAEASDVARMRTDQLRKIWKTLINKENVARSEWAVAEAKDGAAARAGSKLP